VEFFNNLPNWAKALFVFIATVATGGLKFGVPPNEDKCSCPPGYAIRATENVKDKNSRGIYYFPGERKDVQVAWCFKNKQEAEEENFRRPLKTPPKYQS
jgi:hypothetical protein